MPMGDQVGQTASRQIKTLAEVEAALDNARQAPCLSLASELFFCSFSTLGAGSQQRLLQGTQRLHLQPAGMPATVRLRSLPWCSRDSAQPLPVGPFRFNKDFSEDWHDTVFPKLRIGLHEDTEASFVPVPAPRAGVLSNMGPRSTCRSPCPTPTQQPRRIWSRNATARP